MGDQSIIVLVLNKYFGIDKHHGKVKGHRDNCLLNVLLQFLSLNVTITSCSDRFSLISGGRTLPNSHLISRHTCNLLYLRLKQKTQNHHNNKKQHHKIQDKAAFAYSSHQERLPTMNWSPALGRWIVSIRSFASWEKAGFLRVSYARIKKIYCKFQCKFYILRGFNLWNFRSPRN